MGGRTPDLSTLHPVWCPCREGITPRNILQVRKGELEALGSWKEAGLESGLPLPYGWPEGTARATPGRTSGTVVSSHLGGRAFGLQRAPRIRLPLPWMRSNFVSDLIKASPVWSSCRFSQACFSSNWGSGHPSPTPQPRRLGLWRVATPGNLTGSSGRRRSPAGSSRGAPGSPSRLGAERYEVYLQEDSAILKLSNSRNSRRPASAGSGVPSPPESHRWRVPCPQASLLTCPLGSPKQGGWDGADLPWIWKMCRDSGFAFLSDPSVCVRQAGVGRPIYHPGGNFQRF